MKRYNKKLYVLAALAFAVAWFIAAVSIAAGVWL